MSSLDSDPLVERIGPLLLRISAWIAGAAILAPVALILAVPFFA